MGSCIPGDGRGRQGHGQGSRCGQKTAQRLILELKSTFAKDKGFVPVDVIPGRLRCRSRAAPRRSMTPVRRSFPWALARRRPMLP
ncbi:MAG: hypothetical protein ACLTYW_01235 [Collinsella sp.]